MARRPSASHGSRCTASAGQPTRSPSGCRPARRAPRSSTLRHDPGSVARRWRQRICASDNAQAALEHRLGPRRDIATDLYLAHFLGPGRGAHASCMAKRCGRRHRRCGDRCGAAPAAARANARRVHRAGWPRADARRGLCAFRRPKLSPSRQSGAVANPVTSQAAFPGFGTPTLATGLRRSSPRKGRRRIAARRQRLSAGSPPLAPRDRLLADPPPDALAWHLAARYAATAGDPDARAADGRADPAVAAGHLLRPQPRRRADRPDGRDQHPASRSTSRRSRRCCCSRRCCASASTSRRRASCSSPGIEGYGGGGPRHRGVRQLPDRRRLCRRHLRLRDPDDHQSRRHHQGRGAGVRGRGAFHPRRDARQADGDRRRLERWAADRR